jgi:hypothetical protein
MPKAADFTFSSKRISGSHSFAKKHEIWIDVSNN